MFSVLRLGLIVAAGGLLYLVGARGWLLVLLATVVAVPLSYLVLRRQRDGAAQWLAARAERRRAERALLAGDEDDEDAEVANLTAADARGAGEDADGGPLPSPGTARVDGEPSGR